MNNRILIIDDDDHFRSAQKRMLRRMHLIPDQPIQISEADGGTPGMELLQKESFDCILLDHDMPGGSGLKWLQKILDTFPDQAIVMLTGHGSEQLAVEAMKDGAMDYLVKGSITPEEMERAILNAIEKIELRRTIETQRQELMDAERHRVMIESLGTACHHLGQPATVISAYLQMMEEQERDPEMIEMIQACKDASEAMTHVLQRLMQVSQYRTVPYLPGSAKKEEQTDTIIEI